MKHVVITPFHNEEKYITRYIESIINQAHKPDILVLVDDNSTDNSVYLVHKYTINHNWIKLVKRRSTANKIQGSKVIEAFNHGLSTIQLNNFKYISKIDADLELPVNYFSNILNLFENNNTIGIAGGRIMEYQKNSWEIIKQSDYHIRGALKSYRKECFKDIGGLMPVLGWDGLDEMKAFKNEWRTKIIDVNVKHYRPANNDYNSLNINFKYGRANYRNGGNLTLATVRFIVRTVNKPFLIGGISYYIGYLYGYLSKEKRNVDSELSIFINRFHLKRLKKMKRY